MKITQVAIAVSTLCKHWTTTIHPEAPFTDCALVPTRAPELANRYVLVRGKLHGRTIHLHNVYAPSEPEDLPAFFSRPFWGNSQGMTELTAWLTKIRLVDAYRQDNPMDISFTSPTKSNRLDYMFISEALYTSS
ncbi:hypothetical protein ACHHYP_16276 [Achlya hypogyna]|uniref:Uncharacterized protein n=1 Tax=Achlya hypogyna TaxID=1202772 RepID=A0A1V9Y994_ACHHY|nr:hypothetical protein ACHHYP_16276 [Achlya hypogyna]